MTGSGAVLHQIDVMRLNRLLAGSGSWEGGPLHAIVAVERIGADFGLSGITYRVDVAADGGTASLVAKFEASDKLRNAIAFRRRNEQRLPGLLPKSFGADLTGEEGLILLEYVGAAEQGDDLTGCSAAQAFLVVDLVARLHASTRESGPPRFERWARRAWQPGVFEDRVARAWRRYPEAIDQDVADRLAGLESEATSAVDALAGRHASWIHMDPHLDNVLFRPDDAAVLLDWSGAVVGVPALDVAVLLMGLCFRSDPPLEPDKVVERHGAVLADLGAPAVVTSADAALGLMPLLRGTVGGVGLPSDASGREAALRSEAAARIRPALAWIDSNA